MDQKRQEEIALYFDSLRTLEKSPESVQAITSNFDAMLRESVDADFLANQVGAIATLYQKWGLLSETVAVCEKALDYLSSAGGKNSTEYAFVLNIRGESEYYSGELPVAERTFRRVLKAREKNENCCTFEVAESYDNLALVLKERGDYGKSEKYLRKALRLFARIKFEKPLEYIQALTNSGVFYRILGRYDEAEPLYLTAYETAKNTLPETHPQLSLIMNSLGALYLYMGRYEESEELFKRIIAQIPSNSAKASRELAQVSNNYAGLYSRIGQYEKAELFFERAEAICVELLGSKHYYTLQTSLNSVKNLLLKRNPSAVLDRLKKIKPICIQNFPSTHIIRIAAELYHGQALYQTGDFSASETCLTSALQNAETSLGAYHPLTCEILLQRGILDTVTGRRDKALTHLYESCRRQTGMITRIAKAFPEQYIVQYMKTLNESNAIFLSFVQHFFPTDQNALEKALEIIMRRKAVSYESSLMQQQTLYEKQGTKTKALLRKLTKARMELARRVIGEWERKESSELFFTRVKELEKQCEELESELARSLPQAGALLTLEKASRTAIQSRLKNEETLVDFVRYTQYEFGDRGVTKGEEVYAGLMVWKGGPLCLAPLGTAREMDQEIEAFRKAIQPGDGNRGLLDDEEEEETTEITERRALKRSYACLFEPLRKRRFGKHEPDFVPEWIFAPEGQINLVPFEALITPSGRFSVEENRIRYITTARELLWQEEVRPVQQKSAVLFANPAFLIPTASPSSVTGEKNPYLRSLRDSLSAFEPLPGTEQEAKAISELFTEKGLSTDTYTGREASKSNFVKTRQPYLLHIATHGFFMGERQSGELSNTIPASFRSGIVLSGVNNYLQGTIPSKAMQTPILTSFDIFGMNLSGTELVTLSACETGLGLIENGEGVMGLRRSFLTAGAKTVISSLWKVPDDATKTLMALFYKNLLEGRQKSEALREAQLALIAQYKRSDGFAFPWLWAGFICLGADNPLS